MKFFKIICFLLCIVFFVGCGIQKTFSEKQDNEIEITQIYIYQKKGYENIDIQGELGVKIKEETNKILKDKSQELEIIDGSLNWGDAQEKKQISDEEWYLEIIFKEKEKINLANELSYNNITGMFVNIKESVIYLSQDAEVVESGNFGIGLAIPSELIAESFSDIKE